MTHLDTLKEWYRLRRNREMIERIDKEAAWAEIERRAVSVRRQRMWLRWGGIAAMLVVICGAALWWNSSTEESDAAMVAEASVTHRTSREYADIKTVGKNEVVSVPRGASFERSLVDGTRVVINASTELSYPKMFEGNQREVELLGEAYFEVAHDASAPFVVNTPSGSIEVLGTHFNVVAESDKTTVTLAEGSVRLHFGDREFLMKPGEHARIRSNGEIDVRHVNTENYTSWSTGVYDFTDATLDEIVRQLSLWYDVKIEIKDQNTAEALFTGVIERHESLQQALKMLTTISDLEIEVKDNVILIQNQ